MSKQLTARERDWLFATDADRERLARFFRLWVRAVTRTIAWRGVASSL